MSPLSRVLILMIAISLLCLPNAPSAAQTDRRLLFEETFGGNYSGWKLAGDFGTLRVTQNAVVITVSEEGKAAWITPALTVPDAVEIEVEARVIAPDTSGNWNLAVLLRVSERDFEGTFYHFGVAGNGTWEFSVRPPEATSYVDNIAYGELADFSANRPIRLRVLAEGNKFTFYVNNRLVRQFTDDTLALSPNREQFFGLMAGTYSGVSRQTVEFRKIAVYEAVPERVLLRETFPSSNPNDWGIGDSDNSRVRLKDNALVFEVLKANVLSWSQPAQRFPQDIDLQVQVINDAPTTNREWSYGVGVRAYKEGEHTLFYLFEVRGTGEFTFTAQRGGTTISTLIRATRIPNFDPSARHTLRVRAVGPIFTLFVDGVQVGRARSIALRSQADYGILLTAGTFAAPTSQARFTDLVVRRPR